MDVPHLTSEKLKELAEAAAQRSQPACACRAVQFASWESVPEERRPSDLLRIGTLRQSDVVEPTFEEFHPNGTRYDLRSAPIAVDFFPFNRCDVYQCQTCRNLFLRYTEFGGYYVDHRARMLDPALVV